MLPTSEHVFFDVLCSIVLAFLGLTSYCLDLYRSIVSGNHWRFFLRTTVLLMENDSSSWTPFAEVPATGPISPLALPPDRSPAPFHTAASITSSGSHLRCSSLQTYTFSTIKRRPLPVSLDSANIHPLKHNVDTFLSLEIPEGILAISSTINEDTPLDFEWQSLDIPLELRLVQIGTPQEVCKVIREFWQQCEAIKASTRSLGNFTSGVQQSIKGADNYRDSSETAGATSTFSEDCVSVESTTAVASVIERDGKDTIASTGSKPMVYTCPSNAQGLSFSTFLTKLVKGKATSKRDRNHGNSTDIPRRKASKTRECASCWDTILQGHSIDLVCQHSYCPQCFVQLIVIAMQNENLWPPRCCLEAIPRKQILRQLSNTQVLELGMKEKEYSTPAKDRWYCAQATCGKWFVPIKHVSWTKCPHCKYQMCLNCRGKLHPGIERCPYDRDLQATLEEAELRGWMTCYNCKSVVEKTEGCSLMTCKCKAQFW